MRVHAETFNSEATILRELCSWDSNVFEPVLTCSLSHKELLGLVDQPMIVEKRPVHGQGMERMVKQVTKACESVFGQEARDGFIRAGVANRILLPKANTKKNLGRLVGHGV